MAEVWEIIVASIVAADGLSVTLNFYELQDCMDVVCRETMFL